MREIKIFAAAAALALAAACQEGDQPLLSPDAASQGANESPADQPEVAASVPVVGPALELWRPAAEGARAHLAFRAVGGAFRAGHLTHEASVERGTLAVTPRHWDGAGTVVGKPIAFATRAITRGGVALPVALRSSSIERGGLVLERGAATEMIDNREDGLEQSWRFAADPAGAGDLIVQVAVAGYAEAVETASGVHFHNPGRLGVGYSNAVWVDAGGQAWELRSRWDGERIAITVPEDVLAATDFPAVLDPTVGTENAVDSPTTGNTGENAQDVAVAFTGAAGGSQYFAVWADNRNGSESDIFGTRVATDGSIVDTTGVVIAAQAGVQKTPATAFINSKFVVAWEDTGNIKAAFANPNSGMAVTQLNNVAATAAAETLPAMASRGSDGLLVWQSDSNIRGARFSGASFGTPFDIAVTGAVEARPTVAANPAGGFLVAWTEGTANNDVKGQLLTSAGALSGGVITISAAALVQTEPSAAWNGTDFVVAFTSGPDIYGTRVSTAGAVLDTHLESMVAVGGKPVTVATGIQVAPSVGCDGSSCLVVWQDRRNLTANGFDLFGQRMDGAFVAAGGEITVSAPIGQQVAPAVVGAASGFLAGWHDDRNGGANQAVAATIGAAGGVVQTSGFVLNVSKNAQRDPAFAHSATGDVALWSDARVFGNDLRGVRYNASGVIIDNTGALTVSGSGGAQETPAVAFDGTQYLAVWSDGRNATRDIFAARWQTNGSVSEAAGIPVATADRDQLVPDVASNGAGVSLLVWQDRRNGPFDILGAIVTSAGVVSVPDISICTATGDQNRPAVTWDPTSGVFVLVWTDLRSGDADVYAARVQTNGAVLDPDGVLVSGAANGQLRPDIAVSEGQLLAVWDDRRSSTAGDIFGARMTATGGIDVLDDGGLAIEAAASGQAEPTVVGLLGGDFAVAWTDSRNAATAKGDDIFATRVREAGTVDAAFVVSTADRNEANPAFQNDPGDKSTVFVVYQRVKVDINTQRVLRQKITFEGGGGQRCTVANQATQCESGICVDSVCCNEACGGNVTTDCQACSVARGAAVDGTCGVVAAGKLCRSLAGGSSGTDKFCDAKEFCDGASIECPPDLGNSSHVGDACTGVDCPGGGICPAADASAAPHFCDC